MNIDELNEARFTLIDRSVNGEPYITFACSEPIMMTLVFPDLLAWRLC